MDIEEALYRVANELEMVAMECDGSDDRRSQDVEQLPIAWELIRYTVYKKSIENKELRMFLKATENELAHEKEQWDSYFKTGKDSFVNDADTVRGES